jgi:hypothetical protein
MFWRVVKYVASFFFAFKTTHHCTVPIGMASGDLVVFPLT